MPETTNSTELALILSKLEKMDGKLDRLDERVHNLESGLAEFRAEFKVEIKRLDEKIDNLDRRVGILESSTRAQMWTLIVTLVAAIAKVLLLPNWPPGH
jgi:predicted  nucleic acid-binding Zn-ribbon protein